MSQLSRNGESNNSNNATIAIKMDLNNNRKQNNISFIYFLFKLIRYSNFKI
jgi:hypothetical protein